MLPTARPLFLSPWRARWPITPGRETFSTVFRSLRVPSNTNDKGHYQGHGCLADIKSYLYSGSIYPAVPLYRKSLRLGHVRAWALQDKPGITTPHRTWRKCHARRPREKGVRGVGLFVNARSSTASTKYPRSGQATLLARSICLCSSSWRQRCTLSGGRRLFHSLTARERAELVPSWIKLVPAWVDLGRT